MRNRRSILLSIAALGIGPILASCATTADTPRVAPERNLTINATKAKVKEAIAAHLVGRGYQITKDSDFVMDFSKDTHDFWATLLLSSNYDSRVQQRITVTYIGSKPTQVSWQASLITNPGSAFERPIDVTNGANLDSVQEEFLAIKKAVE